MKQTAPQCRALAVATVMLALASGCDSGRVSSAPVRGTVYYQGAPLAGGTIVFIPDEDRGHSGPMARGTIRADGTYYIQTNEPTDEPTNDTSGASPGWYRVTVSSYELDAASGAPRSLLPAKYSDPELSALRCEVKAGRENRIDFRLD